MSEWVECHFSDVLIDGTLSYGIVQPGADVACGIPIIKVNNIRNGSISIANIARTLPSIEDMYRRTRLSGGELLITVVGIIGECAIVPNELAGYNVVRAVSVARIKPEYDIHFIKYCFQLNDIKYQLYANTNDTVQPTLNLTQLKEIEFRVPELPTQRAIAEVLSSLDDKIDLLTRQNATLEALAQTYFRQWFVEDARKDWKEKSLDEIADFLNGLALQNYPCKTGEPLFVIKIKELNNGYSDNSDICSSDIPDKYIVNTGDVIFSWSGSLVVDIWKYGKGALNQHLFKVTSEKYPKWFYYFWIKVHLPEFRIIAESKATTMGHIQRGHLSAAKVFVPTDTELSEMNKIMQPLMDKTTYNTRQIQTLQKLRDTLLPKLISGEVSVKQ